MSNAGFALDELQKAVFQALSTDTGLIASLGGTARVYDYVNEKTPFPYVTIGDNTAKEWGAATFEGQESTFTIHTWAIEHGRLGAQTIMKAIYRALHGKTLSMTTQRMVLMRHDFATVDLDPDGTTYHGVQRFRVLTQGV